VKKQNTVELSTAQRVQTCDLMDSATLMDFFHSNESKDYRIIAKTKNLTAQYGPLSPHRTAVLHGNLRLPGCFRGVLPHQVHVSLRRCCLLAANTMSLTFLNVKPALTCAITCITIEGVS